MEELRAALKLELVKSGYSLCAGEDVGLSLSNTQEY